MLVLCSHVNPSGCSSLKVWAYLYKRKLLVSKEFQFKCLWMFNQEIGYNRVLRSSGQQLGCDYPDARWRQSWGLCGRALGLLICCRWLQQGQGVRHGSCRCRMLRPPQPKLRHYAAPLWEIQIIQCKSDLWCTIRINGRPYSTSRSMGGGGPRRCDGLWQGGGGSRACDITLIQIFIIHMKHKI